MTQAMRLPPEVEHPGSDADLKGFSCLACRQRKIKCDRRTPCSNCVKAERQCSFIPPVRGKRKRANPPKEGLHAKLKRYEVLLRSYGAQLEPSEYGNETESDSEMASRPDVEMAEDTHTPSRDLSDPYGLEESKPMLITKEGTSRYLDSALWSNLGHGFQHSEVDGLDGPMDRLNVQEGDDCHNSTEQDGLLLHAFNKTEDLRSLHLPAKILPKLQEVYIDRVDPVMKILHLPTFWPSLMDVLSNPRRASKSMTAVVFSFYLAIISTLEDDECLSILGAQKPVLYTRYRLAARQGLIDAGFISTSSLTTLQAYSMFMMGVRSNYRRDTLFILSGVAIRLSRKMGLHRDGSSLGLSFFESEMRRRLWWHLVHMDFRLAESLSSRPSMDLFSCDTKMPLNIADEDFSPEMLDPPPERNGITSVVVCLIRCEIIEFLRKFSSPSSHDIRWEVLGSPDTTTARKDVLISQVEDHLERKYLRYCDPSNSLHNLASIMVRSTICKMKLFAHNPRQRADSGFKIPQRERDIVFANASKLLEYATLVPGNPSLEKYTWQVSISYLWNTLVYVLIEARHRKTGPEVDRLWQLIEVVLSKYPQILETSNGAVYTALRKWILEVWDDYIAARRVARLPDPSTPEYVSVMRRCLRPLAETVPEPKKGTDHSLVAHSPIDGRPESRTQDATFPMDIEPLGSCDFSDILSFEMNSNEWLQWEQLIAGEDEFLHLDRI